MLQFVQLRTALARSVSLVLLGTIAGCLAPSAHRAAPVELPGVRDDGRVQLPNQWSLRPAGRQTLLGDFPVNLAVHPDGRYVAALHAGMSTHEIILLELSEGRAVLRARATLEAAFYGICWSADGTRLYCSGGPKERVESFAFAGGQLGERRTWSALPPDAPQATCVPAGVAVTRDGRTLCVAGLRGHEVVALDVAGQQPPLRVALPRESFPYACVLDEAHGRVYVSLWGQSAVALLDWPLRPDATVAATWATGDHPNELLLTRDGATLYVACANGNTVSVLDTETGRPREVICSALYPDAPNGSTPNSIALAPDERTLYIANADNNNLAVRDVSQPGQSVSKGFIPVGWYPTSVRVSSDGQLLLVANGKGTAPKANRNGPNPLRRGVVTDEPIGSLLRGTLSVIPVPSDEELQKLTSASYACSPLRADRQPIRDQPPGNPVPARVGDPSPLRYVIYIIKENRTYDQVFGDMPEGHGDPTLCIFGEDVTPNQHALAREFVLLDNFYAEAEVSADGHEWSTGAYATDFVEKCWPLNYGGHDFGKIGYPSEGAFRIGAPSEGYIWDRCAAAGVSYRSYGEFIKRTGDKLEAKVEALRDHFDPEYEPFNLDVPDARRADRFIHELERFDRQGDMPRFQVLHLPCDHTAGTRAGKRTPIAMVAENDQALGRIVEAVSRSRFWPQTVIFVVEDDAQNGPDHIDAHRTIAQVISPLVARGTVDSSLYSTTSLLRTMELILGLPPLSQFDAAARPMYTCFAPRVNPRPYRSLPARVDLETRNDALAWGAAESATFDFTQADAVDDLALNEIVWRSVRGGDHPMPPPVRAAFVFAPRTRADDD